MTHGVSVSLGLRRRLALLFSGSTLLTIWLRKGALRGTSNVVGVFRILLEKLAKLRDHGWIKLTVAVVVFDIEVKSVHKRIAKGPCYDGMSAQVPKDLSACFS